ncbi:MAG: sensor histidine kinase [Anaerolineaceae bacterium]|nr:sensor histidine kinase [Anaerolineaceae bacterium]
MSNSEFVYKPQDVNYLGFLEAQLRDMTGVHTLAYELIQNADDVQNEDGRFPVTTLSFDVTDEALIVHNNGRFRPIDFERLQNIAGGGKREEAGVTGAFGLGFLAVYQVTDAPEIFSSGRHWIIRPDAPTEQRIIERAAETSGTTFRLPWAFDPASRVRRTLRLEAIRPEQLDSFAQQMGEAVAQAAIFLQRLMELEVRRNGITIRRVERHLDGDRLRLTDATGQVSEWLLLTGDFAAAAGRLRQQYPWQIEEQRHSRVQLALPTATRLPAGRLYAGLPTADSVPLAFYLNADFFPTTDRKRVHFDSGYQAEWNQAAVMAAATRLAESLPELPHLLSANGLWSLLQSTAETARQAQQGDLPEVFAAFWQELEPHLPQTPVFYTAAGEWLRPADGRLLPPGTAVAPQTIIPLLHNLQIPVQHPDLANYAALLRHIGTPTITARDVAAGLHRTGLTRATPLPEAPPFLRTLEAWRPLWALLDGLLRGLPPAERAGALADLNRCAAALTDRMILRPLTQLYRGQPEAQVLFPDVAWLHPSLPDDSFPGRYVPTFGVRQAVERLAEMPIDQLEQAWRLGRLDIPRLFRWFETQQIEIFADDPALAGAIRRLPLCPVEGTLRPLADLFLPGGFEDPLQLAGLVDVPAIGGRRQFLHDLGVQELDFDTYLHSHLPRVLAQQPDLPADGRHRLLHLLARRLGEFRDDEALQTQLSQLPLIPCLDGSFRAAASVYFSREVMDRLGLQVHIAEPVESTAQRALYAWLGVRTTPAPADLVQALLRASREWGTTPLDESTRATVLNCWQALAAGLQSGEAAAEALADLRHQPVMPNGRHILTPPEEMLLADRPDLAEQFADWAPFFLPVDVPWRPAALAAGVRPLSQAVTLTVVHGDEAVVDTAVAKRIMERRPLLARLLHAETAAGHIVQAEVLPDVKVMSLPNLRIQAQLRRGDQVKTAEVQPVSAKWINGVLYLDSETLPVPWTAVARELAQAAAPGRNVVGLALGIKEVLAAETTEDATAVLDELGYP